MEFLNNGFLDLNYLNDVYKKDLDFIFDRVSTPCYILWDYKTKLQVYSIYSPEVLKKNKFLNVTFDEIEDDVDFKRVKSMIFFIPSTIKMIDLAESFIKKNFCKEHHLVFTPKLLSCHSEYLEHKRMTTKFATIRNFRCYGLPIESDLISLEDPHYIMDMSNPNSLYELAKTIILLQNIFGKIPRINGKGLKAPEFIKIFEILQNSCLSNSSSSSNLTSGLLDDSGKATTNNSQPSQIEQMLVFDRRIDMLTPLLSQITYESLLDELFHINSGFVAIPSQFLGEQANRRADLSVYQLNSSDAFYAEVRDLPIYEALNKIIQFSQEMRAEREKVLKAKKIDELAEATRNLKSFLSREANSDFHLTLGMSLNKYTRMANHTDLIKHQSNFLSQEGLDKPHPYVEECFLKKIEIEKVIQLICIQSLCAGGLKPKVLNGYKKDIIRTYGLQYSGMLMRLEKMGLLLPQQASGVMGMNIIGETVFDNLCRFLNLLPQSESLSNIYAGYVPVITRLTQYHRRSSPGGWAPVLSKTLSLLPGQEISYEHNMPANLSAIEMSRSNSSLESTRSILTTEWDNNNPIYGTNENGKRIVLIVCIGGITRSEISTLRLLSQQDGVDSNFLILTTGIINPQTFIEKLAEPFEIDKGDSSNITTSTNPFE